MNLLRSDTTKIEGGHHTVKKNARHRSVKQQEPELNQLTNHIRRREKGTAAKVSRRPSTKLASLTLHEMAGV